MGVITGALAIVRRNGTAIARIRNITATENTSLGEVRGLGTTITIEAPALTHGGTWSAEFYEEFFQTTGIPGIIRRDVQTNAEFEDQLLANEEGVQIDIFKKVEDFVDPDTGLKRLTAVPYAILKRCFIESDGFNIGENAVGSHSQSGRYLDPIKYPR
jgi:hypothetical protein